MKRAWILIFCLVLLHLNVYALNVTSFDKIKIENQKRLEFGHVVRIESIETFPEMVIPGQEGILSFKIHNTGKQEILDVRINLHLPSGLSIDKDVSQKKIPRLNPGEVREISFKIRALPDIDEKTYSANITIDYLNHVGEEREDSYLTGITVKGKTEISLDFESTDLYVGKSLGEIEFKIVNKGSGNLKFVTLYLQETSEYEIIDSSEKYIGNLESDDYDTVKYRIKLKTNKTIIEFPLKVEFSDSLNKPLSFSKKVKIKLLHREELEEKKWWQEYLYGVLVIGVLIVLVIAWARFNKKQKDMY